MREWQIYKPIKNQRDEKAIRDIVMDVYQLTGYHHSQIYYYHFGLDYINYLEALEDNDNG